LDLLSSSSHALAARLERAEARSGEAMARLALQSFPDAAFEPIAGGTAVFAGVGSPMTHALGIGMEGSVSDQEMERLEAFYRDRGSGCLIDLCPLADESVIAFVQSRPYRVIELNNLLVRRIHPEEVFESMSGVREIAESERSAWARVIATGFSDPMPVSESLIELMSSICANSCCLLAEAGDATGGAAFAVQERIALFSGDSVLPEARQQGWQTALIRERLRIAQQKGCDLAMASVLPGSGSHRNYERAGFQLVYMRVNLVRDFT
jgi:GNAT superfamily N-acetyltransferase